MIRYLIICLLVLAAPLGAQEQEPESNSMIISFIEEELSTSNRIIRIRGVEGLLASNARVAEITIADREGIWLTIRNAELVWNRLALFEGRLQIEELGAASIEIARAPLPEDAPPSLEATPLAVPDLPISVEIGALAVPELTLGEPFLGQVAMLDVTGRLSLVSGGMDADLRIRRTDGPGGNFALISTYDPETTNLAVRLGLDEPADGILANTLGIPGRPSVNLALRGEGPATDLDILLALSTDGERRITGTGRIRPDPEGTAFDLDISGRVDLLTEETYRPFLEGTSEVTANGLVRNGGGVTIGDLSISTASLQIGGLIETADDGFLRRVDLQGTFGDGETPTILPFGDGTSTLKGATLAVDYGASDDGAWTASLEGDQLVIGGIGAERVALLASGIATGIETPETRRVTATVSTNLLGLTGNTPDLTRALGQDVLLGFETDWRSGEPFALKRFNILGRDLSVIASGELEDWSFQGRIRAEAERLNRFSGLVGRTLGGAVDLGLEGRVSPLLGSFDLTIAGTSEALRVGVTELDRLLAGTTELRGRAIRDETGIQVRNGALRNDQVRITSDGLISSALADFRFDARLADLGDLGLDATGAVTVIGKAEGQDGDIAVSTRIEVPEARLGERSLRGTRAAFDGRLQDGVLTGTLSGAGDLDTAPLSLRGRLALGPDSNEIDGLVFRIGPNTLTGRLVRGPEGLFRGGVGLRAPDISPIAALALAEASGRANLEIDLEPNANGQSISATGSIADIVTPMATIRGGDLDMVVENALGIPAIAGALTFVEAETGGVSIANGRLAAREADGDGSAITATARLQNGTRFGLNGRLRETAAGYAVTLAQLELDGPPPEEGEPAKLIRLAEPAELQVAADTLGIGGLLLDIGGGTVALSGDVAEEISVDAAIEAVPLSILNAISPGLGISGILDGNARASGPRAAPVAAFELSVTDLASENLRDAELPPVDASLTGETEGETLRLDALVEGPGNFTASGTGAVPLGEGEMDLTGSLDRFPLALVDRLAGRPGLRGTVDGTYGVSGTLAAPRVRFNVTGQSLSTSALRDNRIAPLDIRTSGSFREQLITIGEGRIQSADGLDFTTSGRIPLVLDGLDLVAKGRVPLSVVQFALARSGLGAEGILDIGVTAKGRLGAPSLAGKIDLQGGTFVIPVINLRLDDLALDASLNQDRLSIASVTARNSRGGTVRGSGEVTLDASQGFPSDIRLDLENVRYTDGNLASADLGGEITLTGPLGRSGAIAGNIDIQRLEFRVPDTAAAPDVFQLEVSHAKLSPELEATLERARLIGSPTRAERSESGLRLDILFRAPSRVFVRGRGLDAEMGGEVRLGGTVRGVKPFGQFDLQRGRFTILGQRIDLTAGSVRFIGTPIPELLIRAATQIEDVEATVSLEGPSNQPVVAFSSVPDLPDDEILAQIIFRRAISDLSPLQVARLANALAEISGRGGIGFFENVRRATGLDDLDFQTEDDGSTSLRAGKYIRENIYSTIEADTEGNSKASIILDITDDLTARGTVDNNGDTTFGVFFERDY